MYRPSYFRSSVEPNNLFRAPANYRPRFHTSRGFRHSSSFHHNMPYFSTTGKNSEEHWCETCDRAFGSSELLDKHKGQHQRCNIDGCQFVAHPKVITKHIQMQHSSGVYKKIAKLNNPEEIQKWRDERRKKYPTKSTIEKKTAELKEKLDRGEKMGLRNKRPTDKRMSAGVKRINEFNNHNNRHRYNLKKLKCSSNECSNKPKPPRTLKSLPITETKNKLLPFTGIHNIVEEDTDDESNNIESIDLIEDDEFHEPIKPDDTAIKNESGVCSALSALMCEYESSDNEDTSIELNEQTKKRQNTNNSNLNTNATKINTIIGKPVAKDFLMSNPKGKELNAKIDAASDDSGPEEVKINKDEHFGTSNGVDSVPTKYSNHNNKNKKNNKQFPRNKSYMPKRKLPSTLLTKLLHREMQHERNIILQCIRYIIRKDYLKSK